MEPRTNYNVINKEDNSVILAARARDCFGQYTSTIFRYYDGRDGLPELIREYKDHKILYFLPEFFTYAELIDGEHMLIKLDNYKDKLIFNDEEIEIYLDWLREIGVPIKKVEDTPLEIKGNFGVKRHPDVPEFNVCKTLEIDINQARNIKEAKLWLFLARYLIDGCGNQILKRAFELYKENSDIDKWDLFLMSEFIERFVKQTIVRNNFYITFAEHYMYRYYSINEFIDKIILKHPGDFNYITAYERSNLLPYYVKETRSENNDKKVIAIEHFKKAYKELSTVDFFNYWKNYKW